jgi:uncharacterized protein YutE (UPF0331/DUF86 family)
MVDKTLVLRKLSDLDEYGTQIAEYATVSAGEYKADWKVQRIIERTLQVMIETCLDIAGHIIADRGFRAPDSYADMFRILQANGILEEAQLPAMEKMARFRNLVVHQYEKIDPDIVVSILNKNLPDFERYRDSITAYLQET